MTTCKCCDKKIRSDNKSGYCRKHSSFGNRIEKKYCLKCGKKLRSSTNKNGYCREHRYISTIYKETMKKASILKNRKIMRLCSTISKTTKDTPNF